MVVWGVMVLRGLSSGDNLNSCQVLSQSGIWRVISRVRWPCLNAAYE